MTLEELVKLNPNTIRRDSSLMPLYIDYYTAAFGKAPNCAPCTFKSDFKKLQKYVTNGQHTFVASAP